MFIFKIVIDKGIYSQYHIDYKIVKYIILKNMNASGDDYALIYSILLSSEWQQ